MQQLGAGFTNSFLIPYIQNRILGNIENDTRLQNIFRYDKVLTPSELNGLVETYFKSTGTIFEHDFDLRGAFWNEFIEFVKGQKKLCNGNNLKLAFRLLPDAESGSFSQEAKQNLQKFAFYAVNKLEDTLIQREIDQKEVLGKISSGQAADDKADLKNGKMILVRQKDGNFDYMSNETVANAIGNTERTAKLLANLYTEKTPEGETRVYAMNPTELQQGEAEISLGLNGIQALLWEKQSMMSEKQLEDNGIYVEAHMTVDANGISRGFAQDKNGTRLRIEFDVKKPGERVYRITFADNPDNKFFMSENELKQKFGKENQSAHEVFREKENAAGRGYGVVKPRGSRISGLGAPIKLPADRKIISGPSGAAGASSGAAAAEGSPYRPNVGTVKNEKSESEGEITRQNELNFSGAMDAKRNFYDSRKNGKAEMETSVSTNESNKNANRGKLKASRQRPEKSFVWQVVKINAASLVGMGVTSGVVSLLT